MSTSNNFEKHIKKQIGEREVVPSRDLWAEIQAQTPKESTQYRNWYLAAACMVLIVSMGTILLFFNDGKKEIERPQMASSVVEKEIDTAKNIISTSNFENVEPKINKQNNIPENKQQLVQIEPVVEKESTQNPISVEKNSSLMEISKIQTLSPSKIIAAVDSSKVPVKKKKYVDPSTLLFSVEHKDVIQKTKESNVASIDLHGN